MNGGIIQISFFISSNKQYIIFVTGKTIFFFYLKRYTNFFKSSTWLTSVSLDAILFKNLPTNLTLFKVILSWPQKGIIVPSFFVMIPHQLTHHLKTAWICYFSILPLSCQLNCLKMSTALV